MVVPFERGPPEATPAGNVYEHWYVDLPPRVRSSRMAKTDNSNLSIILHDVVDVVIVKKVSLDNTKFKEEVFAFQILFNTLDETKLLFSFLIKCEIYLLSSYLLSG